MNADEVRGLKKSCGDIEAVRGVDFDVRAGETFGFLGPNGAGMGVALLGLAIRQFQHVE